MEIVRYIAAIAALIASVLVSSGDPPHRSKEDVYGPVKEIKLEDIVEEPTPYVPWSPLPTPTWTWDLER